jgi:hypothetical protein
MQPAGAVGDLGVERGKLGLYERGRLATVGLRAGFAVGFGARGTGVFF